VSVPFVHCAVGIRRIGQHIPLAYWDGLGSYGRGRGGGRGGG
jgi:hypothetical protein